MKSFHTPHTIEVVRRDEVYRSVTIPRKSHFFLDVFHIDKATRRFFLWVDKPTERDTSNSFPAQGVYEIHLFLAGKSIKPHVCIIRISWDGRHYLKPDVQIIWCNKEVSSEANYEDFHDEQTTPRSTTTTTTIATSGACSSETTTTNMGS